MWLNKVCQSVVCKRELSQLQPVIMRVVPYNGDISKQLLWLTLDTGWHIMNSLYLREIVDGNR